MIESSFLCSSSWDSDLFQDFIPDLEPTSIFDAIEYVGKFDSKEPKPSSCSTTPDDSSSSDYEFLCFDDLSNILPISDTFVSQILEEETNATGISDFDISSISNSPNHKSSVSKDINSNYVSNSSSPIKRKKHKRAKEHLSSKSWSKMSPDEQLRTLHSLSEIVTCHMGIREQMEVIKIIDPTAVISPDDKEFALDSSFLNDSKLRRIKDFVKKHAHLLSNSSSKSTNSSSSIVTSKKIKTQNSSFHRTKRRQRKSKESSFNELDVREHKVQEQGKKEVKSGLFVYEKKIKKLNNPSEEDEDVNILE